MSATPAELSIAVSADRNGLNVHYLSGAFGIYSQDSGVAT